MFVLTLAKSSTPQKQKPSFVTLEVRGEQIILPVPANAAPAAPQRGTLRWDRNR